jgi:hypothetical protein
MMKNGFREFSVLLLAGVSVGAFFRYRDNPSAASDPGDEMAADLIVWNSDKPAGQTWASLGPRGKIEFPDGSGMGGQGKALTLRMTGDGYRGCGLNWKGWYPADAYDDVSRYGSLVFYIRQATDRDPFDLSVTLVDNVKRPKGEQASNVLHVVGDGGVPRIDGRWRKVVLPLEKFAQNKPLRLDRLWGIDFANVGAGEAVVQIDRIAFVAERPAGLMFPARSEYKAAARLDLAAVGHPINDGIYGVCGLPDEKLRAYGITITRWGGNPSSRYNWKINADNGAADWFFKNRGAPIKDLAETGYLAHVRGAQKRDATTYQTVPTLGWVAKDHGSYGFSVKKYGAQKGAEPNQADVGDGRKPDGNHVCANDPRDTSVEAGPDFIAEAVRFVSQHAGPAAKGGVTYWALDNEPMLWHETHRDVRQKPLGYDELWERTVAYAEAIKKADPTAKVAGFCSWGWTDLFYSALDEGGDRYATCADRKAHGDEPLAEWFIRKCGEYKKRHGKPLIDVFDFHWYPQGQVSGQTPYSGKGMGLALNELRLRSTRDLWDPEYGQESWIRNAGDRKPTRVIRRVKEWVEKHNPGMELCLGEYNFGGADNITGGLAQADAFGILAREKVDLAFLWHTPEGTQELAWQLFRNYDGAGGRFGGQYVPLTGGHPDLAVHAAKRKDGATTIAIVNKNLGGECELKLEVPGLKGTMRVWRFDQDERRVVTLPGSPVVDETITLKIPAASASMLVVK